MTVYKHREEKILLVLLPFWTSLIPPLGISCLKSFLQKNNYSVKIVDTNIERELNEIYNKYFDVLKKFIPPEKRGNFYNIGNDVLRNHMMAHLNYKNDEEYLQLVRLLISKTFYHYAESLWILELKELIDLFFKRLENFFFRLLEKEKPTVLGLSVFNGTLPASLFVFKFTRERYPYIKTVMGGGVFADLLAIDSPNFNFFLKKTPFIDKIIVGEGEMLFLKLLHGELPESQRVFTLKDITWETLDFDMADIPDYSDLEIFHYPNLSTYVSRSCPFQCSFCSETVQWGKFRKKTTNQIVDELIRLNKIYKSQLFLMGDSLLNPVINDLSNELIKKDIPIYWDGYLRVDHHACNPETVLLWRRGGFYRARLGVESGSQKILDMMRKGLNVELIKMTISNLASVGIKTTTYWVIGYPGETEEDFQLTLALIEELKDDIYEADCNPFNFYMGGQVNSDNWKSKSTFLYPEEFTDILMVQTWSLNCEPSREETYQRLGRFVNHCKRLGIPNPYSLNEIYKADERWKKLKKNATPFLLEFKQADLFIDECKRVKQLLTAHNSTQHDGNWGF